MAKRGSDRSSSPARSPGASTPDDIRRPSMQARSGLDARELLRRRPCSPRQTCVRRREQSRIARAALSLAARCSRMRKQSPNNCLPKHLQEDGVRPERHEDRSPSQIRVDRDTVRMYRYLIHKKSTRRECRVAWEGTMAPGIFDSTPSLQMTTAVA
jgi:hypothetical protein